MNTDGRYITAIVLPPPPFPQIGRVQRVAQLQTVNDSSRFVSRSINTMPVQAQNWASNRHAPQYLMRPPAPEINSRSKAFARGYDTPVRNPMHGNSNNNMLLPMHSNDIRAFDQMSSNPAVDDDDVIYGLIQEVAAFEVVEYTPQDQNIDPDGLTSQLLENIEPIDTLNVSSRAIVAPKTLSPAFDSSYKCVQLDHENVPNQPLDSVQQRQSKTSNGAAAVSTSLSREDSHAAMIKKLSNMSLQEDIGDPLSMQQEFQLDTERPCYNALRSAESASATTDGENGRQIDDLVSKDSYSSGAISKISTKDAAQKSGNTMNATKPACRIWEVTFCYQQVFILFI